MNASQFAPGHGQISGMLSSTSQQNRVEIPSQVLNRDILADLGVGLELYSLRCHLFETTVDDVLFKFELRNPVSEQSADAVRFFIDHDIVPGPAELLCRSEPGWARSDNGDLFSAANLCRLRADPSLQKPALHDVLFVLLDCDWRLIDT